MSGVGLGIRLGSQSSSGEDVEQALLDTYSPVAWWRSDDMVESGSWAGQLEKVTDRTGNGYFVDTVVQDEQPSIQEGGLGGQPFWRNAGGAVYGDQLVSTNAEFPNTEHPVSLVLVFQLTATDGDRFMFDGTATSRCAFYVQPGGKFGVFAGNIVATTMDADTNAHWAVVVYDGASSYAYIDGTQVLTSADPGSNSLDAIIFGCDSSFNRHSPCDFYEGIIIPSAVSHGDCQAGGLLGRYMNRRYGLGNFG